MTNDTAKLYIAVRDDLPPGLQMAQAVHAAFAYAHQHREQTDDWLLKSNYLVIVSVPDEAHLYDLITTASLRTIRRVAVREPDLDDELTAVAFEPTDTTRKLCANLPLALKEKAMT